MAAFLKEILRVCLLEIAATDLGRRNLRRDRKHRHPASVSIEQPVDEMQVARSARARADRQVAGHLRFAGSGKGRDLLMAYMNPFDRTPAAQRLGETVQAIAYDPEDSLDASLLYRCYEKIGYVAHCHEHSRHCRLGRPLGSRRW
jgi:hypothetical protein